MKKNLKAVFILGLCLFLNACDSIYEKETVGIGSDISELKRSPCACMLLKLPAGLPDWISANG
ncbi:MAG: hypothetical protein IKR09_03690 [Alphaproteobacteria bacterium]|nr:hypothetical protein [Alphaproteobacteria bacterium]